MIEEAQIDQDANGSAGDLASSSNAAVEIDYA